MKRRRSNAVLVIVLGALLGLLLFGLFSQRELSRSSERLSLDITADVTEITLSRRGETVALRRGALGWVVEQAEHEFPARDARVELLIESLRNASIARSVTADRALWDRFGVGEGATIVSLAATSDELDLVVGSASEGEGTFVRMRGKPEVYEIDAALSFFVEQTLGFWLLLRILPDDVDADDVIALRVRARGALREAGALASFELVREGESEQGVGWRVTRGGGTPTEVTISRSDGLALVSEVVDMVGASFWLGDWDELAPAGEVVIELADGRSFALVIRGVGPFVITPSGPSLPGAPYGGLRYAVATARLVRATDGADLRAVE